MEITNGSPFLFKKIILTVIIHQITHNRKMRTKERIILIKTRLRMKVQ